MSSPQNPSSDEDNQSQAVAGATEDGRIFVVTPNAMAVEGPPSAQVETDDDESPRSVTEMVEQPAKVMRIGSMIRQLLDEVKAAPLDEASRQRLRSIHSASIGELKEGLAPELVEELDRITLPFSADETPTDAELRIAQAQLVGWLEGLFHGLQTALVAQQMSTQAQLAQMRRALPPGVIVAPTESGDGAEGDTRSPGQYL